MEPKVVFGILINLICWPLILYWILASRKSTKEVIKLQDEYNRPENKFKRKIDELELKLPFKDDRFYPYIKIPSHFMRQHAAKVLDPDDVENNHHDIQIGASERVFYMFVAEYFGEENIYLGGNMVCGFFPDILYIDNKNIVYIDIEIDEPYSFKSKEPIHYISSIGRNSSAIRDINKERDKILVKNGWTVIRFSERQIKEEALSCIQLIEYVISYLKAEEPYKQVEEIKIEPQKRCTKDEAMILAQQNSRVGVK